MTKMSKLRTKTFKAFNELKLLYGNAENENETKYKKPGHDPKGITTKTNRFKDNLKASKP